MPSCSAGSTRIPVGAAYPDNANVRMKPGSLSRAGGHIAFFCALILFSSLFGCYPDVSPAGPEQVSRRLSELLADPDPEVRRTAAEALGKIGHQSASTGLIAALEDRDPSVRAAAAFALGRMNDGTSGTALVAHLADASETVRAASALALGEIRLSAAHEKQILRTLHHPNAAVRVAASRALLSLEVVSFSPQLTSALGDTDAQVRQGVAAVLGETGDARVVPSLVHLVRNDADGGVRAEAAFRLGKVGGIDALGTLSAVAEKDVNPTVREWARWAIRQIAASSGFDSGNRQGQ